MPKKRYRKSLFRPEPLAFVLDRAGENRFAPDRSPFPRGIWLDAVGARVAERAEPVTLDRGVLVVRVATSVWASELSLLAPTILARLRAHGIDARDARFTVGKILSNAGAKPTEIRESQKLPKPVPLPVELQPLLAAIDDDGLRAEIERAARAHLAWQKHVEKRASAAPLNGAPPAARDPRGAGTGTAPPARTTEASPEAARGTRGDAGDRRR